MFIIIYDCQTYNVLLYLPGMALPLSLQCVLQSFNPSNELIMVTSV